MYLPVSSLIVGVDNSRLMERFLLLSSGVYSPAEVLGNLFWLLSLILHTEIFIMNLGTIKVYLYVGPGICFLAHYYKSAYFTFSTKLDSLTPTPSSTILP